MLSPSFPLGSILSSQVLARTSHQPSATTADMASPASLRSVGRPRRIAEDTPSTGLGRKPCGQCHLSHSRTKAGEKSGIGEVRWFLEIKQVDFCGCVSFSEDLGMAWDCGTGTWTILPIRVTNKKCQLCVPVIHRLSRESDWHSNDVSAYSTARVLQ